MSQPPPRDQNGPPGGVPSYAPGAPTFGAPTGPAGPRPFTPYATGAPGMGKMAPYGAQNIGGPTSVQSNGGPQPPGPVYPSGGFAPRPAPQGQPYNPATAAARPAMFAPPPQAPGPRPFAPPSSSAPVPGPRPFPGGAVPAQFPGSTGQSQPMGPIQARPRPFGMPGHAAPGPEVSGPGTMPGAPFAPRPMMGPMPPGGQFASSAGPPPAFGGGMGPPPPFPGISAHPQAALVDAFEALTLGGAPGPGGAETDLSVFPRPTGADRAKALAPAQSLDVSNCSPDNMRLTVNAIPNSSALRARWALPLGLIVQPMGDEAQGRSVPVVPLGGAGIVRCRRCRTYMNPFMQWLDNGRRFRCNVCALMNEVPSEYFSNMDHQGRRQDHDQRPELSRGTVEYIAPTEYMVRPPMPPVYCFVIDVSYSAIVCGMVKVAAAAIKSCLDDLPGDERTSVAFITFDSSLHFYNMKASLSQPQMLVVGELEEPFVPLPEELLVNLKDSRHVADAFLDSLPNTFAGNTVVENAMGPALQAAFLLINHIGGKMLLFQSNAASLGIGRTKDRENFTLYNTEREPSLRNADDPFYKRFAGECSRAQITLDVFAFGAHPMDLASLATIPRYTCGELRYFPAFSAPRDGLKLHNEIRHNLTRCTAWEAVMRIRCSKGLHVSSFHGHFFNRSTDLLALPTCDQDKSFAVQIAHEETLVSGPVAYVQCALLYTNSNGERRIRVHSMQVPIVSELSDMYKMADGAALACILSKLSVERSLSQRLEECRHFVQSKITQVLKEFRLLHSNFFRQPNQLILPEALKYLPLLALGIVKLATLRGGAKDVMSDERMAVGHDVMGATTSTVLRLTYPDCYSLLDTPTKWGTEGEGGAITLPDTVPASKAAMKDSGAYLLDNGRILVLWIGITTPRDWAAAVFGLKPDEIPADLAQLSVEPARNTELSRRLNNVLKRLRQGRAVHQLCFVVRQGSPVENLFAPLFVEDRYQNQISYYDFVSMLHKTVLTK